MTDATSAPDPSAITAEQFAELISQVSDEQLAEGLATNRELILGEIFKRMVEHYDPAKGAGVEAVVDWVITGKPDGDDDRWQLVIRGGEASVVRDGEEPAAVTYSVSGLDFLKLVTGSEQGPALFMTGRLKIEGDLMLAARMQGFFKMPGAAAA